MDTFNVKRRDHPSMDKHMNPKAEPFGGPKETAPFDKNKRKSLDKYQRIITRNKDFEGGAENRNYDTTWKAITRDRISRDANKKPTDVMYAKNTVFTKAVEEGKVFRFEEFVAINEEFDMNNGMPPAENFENEGEKPLDSLDNEENPDMGYEVDEEQLEKVMDEYGDDLTEIIDKIAEDLEIEKDAVCDLLCAAVEKICKPEDDEEGGTPDDSSTDEPGEEPKVDEMGG